jgi:hypothetical protein
MTWVSPPRAYWRKAYRGKVYTISCRELGVEKTKEGSYQAANAWWQQKKAEIDTASVPVRRPALPLEDLVAACEGKESGFLDRSDVLKILFRDSMKKVREYSRFEALLEARENDETLEENEYEDRLPADPDASKRKAIRLVFGELLVKHLIDGEPLPEQLARILPVARVQQVEASLVELRGESSAPADRTVKHFNGRCLERKKLGSGGTRTAGTREGVPRELDSPQPAASAMGPRARGEGSSVTEGRVTPYQRGDSPSYQRIDS